MKLVLLACTVALAGATSLAKPALAKKNSPLLENNHGDAVKNVLSLRGGALDDVVCHSTAAIYGGFGIALLVAPEVCFGRESAISYWKEFGDAGRWFARALGITMLTMFTSHWWADMPTDALGTALFPLHFIFTGLFISAATSVENAAKSENDLFPFNMWWTQIPISVVLTILSGFVFCDNLL